jgi:hypothetical protein
MSLVVLFFQSQTSGQLNEGLDPVVVAAAGTVTVSAALGEGLDPVTLAGAGVATAYNPLAATSCWTVRRRAA